MLALVAVVIIAALGVGLVILLGSPASGPGLDHVAVTVAGGATALDPSSSVAVSAAAVDTKGVDQTANATFTWSASPAGDVSITHPGSPSAALVTALQAGAVTLTTTATWSGSSKSGTASLTVNALSFAVTANNYHPAIGSGFLLFVRVARADNTTDTTFNGIVHFTSSDPSATLPADTLIAPADAGNKTFANVIVNAAGTTTITAANASFAITGSVLVYGNHPPVASFTITPSNSNPRQVGLDASGSSDPDAGNTLTYSWDFGDGNNQQLTVPTTSHTYAATGTYTITLTVQDNYGASGSATHAYTAHTPPFASFKVAREAVNSTANGIEVTFDASASTGGDGMLVTYGWSFGDGKTGSGSSALIFHNYSMTYSGHVVTVNLTVTNNYTLTNMTSRPVTVSTTALPPIAAFDLTINDYMRRVSVDGSSSSTQTGQPIVYYNWTWGDGSTWTNTTSPTATHTYSSDSTFTITLTVVDSLNLKDSIGHPAAVALVNVAPVALFTYAKDTLTLTANASTSFDLNGNLAWFTWTWGDSSPAQTVPSSQVLTSHTYGAAGLYQITLVANDTTNMHSFPATRYVSVAASTLDYRFYDFFNVPYGEWWDLRLPKYGDLPIRANCFSQQSINDGVCPISNPGLQNASSYPYTDWYPQPAGTGSNSWSHIGNDPLIYAPYRFDVVGVNQGGYNASEPVFLPVLNYAAKPAPASYVDFNWSMQYLDIPTATYVTGTLGCPLGSGPHFGDDGFMIRSQIDLTMDEQEAARIFGADTSSLTNYKNFWTAQSVPCNAPRGFPSSLETNVESWFSNMGNTKYDVFSSFQYFYSPFYVQISATVDSTGTTHVHIDTSAWGTETLLARMFYWGNASYQANYLNSAAARGWWGMELAWFEDFHFTGGLTTSGMDFHLNTAMEYHFNQLAAPGPDGHLRSSANPGDKDDVPYWVWGPWLSDYIPGSSKHVSELTRYTSPYSTYTGYNHSTPGTGTWIYGVNSSYEFIPSSWAPKAGEQWHFEFPFGNVVFYDPTNSLQPSNPVSTDFKPILTPVAFWTTSPGSTGWGSDVQSWNQTQWTWDAFGSASPPSWPCGCANNKYPYLPVGSIIFSPQGWSTGLGVAPQVPNAAPAPATPTARLTPRLTTSAAPATVDWSMTAVATWDLLDPTRSGPWV